jgi:hypothetical protein
VGDLARDVDLGGFGEGDDAGSDVHAIAEDLVASEDGLAQVDADADLEVGGILELVLHCKRAVDRVECALECGQALVARRFDEPAVVARNLGAD